MESVSNYANIYADESLLAIYNEEANYMSNLIDVTLNNANNYTDLSVNTIIYTGKQYTDSRINEYQRTFKNEFLTYSNGKFGGFDKDINQKQKQLNAGIAATMAAAVIPQKSGSKVSIGVGLAGYSDQGAGSVGAIWHVNQRITMNTTMTYDTQRGVSLLTGLSIGI
ncbi:yadA-like family protein [Yersinia pestis PY-53]|nr:yadA-like family protein [Yersinia pestis PY-53]